MRKCAVVLCLLAITACDQTPTGPSAALNSEFVLAPGATMHIEAASVSIRFDGVTGDSRCPADAFCILGGDAIVRITATTDGAARQHELHTGSMQPVRHNDLTITLVQLSPYPFSSRTIAPGEYRATLRVTR